MSCTEPCPNCGQPMSFAVYVQTHTGSLYVTAYGVCPKCDARWDAYGFSPKVGSPVVLPAERS